MKVKNLAGGLIMAIVGAVIALFAYSRMDNNNSDQIANNSANNRIYNAQPMLASYQQLPGQVDFTYAAEQTVHAVVHVRTSTVYAGRSNNPIMEWFYGDSYRSAPREVKGYGSGVIITTDGYIITNNHVIENAENVTVKLNDNREYDAKIIGSDPSTDIALLKIDADNLPFVKYGDSDNLKLGEWVLAVGNPFNLTSTVTAGIVSAKGRNLQIIDDRYRIESFIQTDAALNMGNSGGALVNTSGQLIGITSAIISPSGAYAGNSFAIPVNIVKKVVEDLREYGEVQRAIIGVSNIQDVSSELIESENLKLSDVKGVFIDQVVPGSSADDAGIKSKDVIVRLNGVPVSTVSELQEQVGKFRPGDRTNITYIRGGKETTVPITMKNIENTTSLVKAGVGGGVVYGAKLEPLTDQEKDQYQVDHGVKVVELNDGLFKDMGIRRGYVILAVNGKKVKTATDVRESTGNEKTLTSIEGYQSNGTYFNYSFRR